MIESRTPDGADPVGTRPPDFVEALARGLAVMSSFGRERDGITLTEVAKRTGLSRGTARRLLHTLRTLDYVGSDGKLFWLTPKVFGFSAAYLARLGLGESGKAVLREVTERLKESSSIAVLDGAEVVYVARLEMGRLYSSRIDVGTRLPAHCSSLGQVLLAHLAPDDLDAWLRNHPLTAATARTVTDSAAFRDKLDVVRRQGFTVVDGELEIGIRSIAVPIRTPGGRFLAALNASTSSARVPLATLRRSFLPVLQEAAGRIGQTMDW